MFPTNVKNFGILCRGKSLIDLPNIEQNFDMCYIVNNFENELYHFENILKKKNCSFCK